MTRSEEQLLHIMKTVDAHSVKVAAKHYVLRTPDDDARLAKAMVHSLIGEPVPWPEHHQLQDSGTIKPILVAIQAMPTEAEPDGGGEGDGDIDGPADDLDLEYSDGLEAFGIQQPLLAIGDVDDGDNDSPVSDAIAEDDAPSTCQPEAHSFYNPTTGKLVPRPTGHVFMHEPLPENFFGKQASLHEVGIKGGSQVVVTRPAPSPPLTQQGIRDHFVSVVPVQSASSSGGGAADAKAIGEHSAKKRKLGEQHASEPVKVKVEHEFVSDGRHRTRLDPDHMAWITDRHTDEVQKRQLPEFSVLEKAWFDSSCTEYVAAGKLGPFTTAEGIRSYIRRSTAVAKADAEQAKLAKREQKRENKDAKKEKADTTDKKHDKHGKDGKKGKHDKKDKALKIDHIEMAKGDAEDID
jgi:hypothetical protein